MPGKFGGEMRTGQERRRSRSADFRPAKSQDARADLCDAIKKLMQLKTAGA